MKLEQTTETISFLLRAKQEAEAHNWLEVNYYLQQLPIFATKSSFDKLDRSTQEQILQLALTVLINGDFQQKWNVAKLFPTIKNCAIAPLIELLDNETIDTETQWFTARILGHFPEQRVVVALAKLLENTPEPDLIAIAAKSLAKIGTPAIETLISLLEKPEYRLVAAKSLAYIRLATVIPALLELVKDENPEIRLLAIEALGSFHEREITTVIIKALKDTNSMVRKEAVIAIGFNRDFCQELDLVTHLQPLLYDLNLDVCRQTAISLGRMGNESATIALNEALISPNTPLVVKLDLVKALAWSEIALALEYLQEALKTESDLVCQTIITVLGRISVPELRLKAIAILRDFWDSCPPHQMDFETKKALAMALGELQAVTEQSILEQLAQDEVKMVRLYALSSLKKISK